MGLSTELISQFVKVNNNDRKKKSETTVYGTIVEYNGSSYVQLDGSELLTPVTTTTHMQNGERVTVLIKNHTATVTGNISSPSVRETDVDDKVKTIVADHVTTKELEAERARITQLEADKVTINGNLIAANAKISKLEANKLDASTATITYATIANLEAAKGDIDDLKANKLDANVAEITYATINSLDAIRSTINNLNATYATIKSLDATNARIDNLGATYATITDLNAAKATISALDGDIADINTLIFGSATGNTIQTSFANAVIAQLGNAQIKSAMIESISAGKITSGDIVTNNVRVKSADGSLLISDDTMQISDGTRVRVQIGKDASGDYSINIWDQNGALMFSKGGITDSAIKDAIIRNDMVSDTANIAAHKLDIDSLFEEINGSTNTIKSTKVYLDDKKQTLDVAFKSISDTVTSQGTAISAIQGQISSKIWQQDINTASNAMNTKYTELKQTVDGVSSTVTKHTTELSNLEIGGRNLLPSTNQGKTNWSLNGADGTYFVESYTDSDGVSAVKLTTETASTSWNFASYWMASALPMLQPSTKYVLTFDMKTNVSETLQMSIRKGDGLKILANMTAAVNTINDEEWHKYTFYISTNDLSAGLDNQCLYFSRFNTVGYRIIKNLKLEKGTKPTDWTPAPEDISKRVSLAETKISQNEESIILAAENLTKNYSTTSQMNAAIGLKADEIFTKVSEVQSNIDNMSIGGRNLLSGYGTEEITLKDYQGIGGFTQFNILTIDSSRPEYIGKEFTVSLWAKSPNGPTALHLYNSNGDPRYFRFSTILDNTLDTEWKYYQYTFTNKDFGESHTGKYTRIEIYAPSQLGVIVKKIKVEMGNKATDWSPAPENADNKIADLTGRVTSTESSILQLSNKITSNVTETTNLGNRTSTLEQTASSLEARLKIAEGDIVDAAKTATNYLGLTTSGLVVGNMTSSTLGNNVLIDTDSVDIRNGSTTLASFGSDYLYLAKNSRNATINMCNGLATMYHASKYSYDSLFVIDTAVVEIIGASTPLCLTSTSSLENVSIQFANSSKVLGGIGIIGSWLRRYGSNMYDTYTILDAGNFHDVMDGGWVHCSYGDGFTRYSNNHANIQVRKVGKQVYLRGEAKPTTAVTPESETSTVLAVIPEGYRPSYRQQFVMQGSSAYRWLMSIHTNGNICISRYTNDTTMNKSISAGAWLCCHAQWMID